MAGETLSPQATPNEPGPNWLYSAIELDVIVVSREMRQALHNQHEAEAGMEAVEEHLKRWQESGLYFPFRAWARDIMSPSRVNENGEMIPHRYSDGIKHELIGGWIPANRYRILEVHHDITDGLMAWVQAQGRRVDTSYHILPSGLQLVDDATISRESSSG